MRSETGQMTTNSVATTKSLGISCPQTHDSVPLPDVRARFQSLGSGLAQAGDTRHYFILVSTKVRNFQAEVLGLLIPAAHLLGSLKKRILFEDARFLRCHRSALPTKTIVLLDASTDGHRTGPMATDRSDERHLKLKRTLGARGQLLEVVRLLETQVSLGQDMPFDEMCDLLLKTVPAAVNARNFVLKVCAWSRERARSCVRACTQV